MKTLSLDQVLMLHKKTISLHGGSDGIRDISLVQSALARPHATFDGVDLYSTIEEKIASVVESLVCNHAFVDGNKRIGAIVLMMLCYENGLKLIATEDEIIEFILSIASGDKNFEIIVKWIIHNTI